MPTLITKLPEGKDPCICILLEKEFEAQKTNEYLVEKFKHDKYSITIWPTGPEGKALNLMLSIKDNQRFYKHLKYDSLKLVWWLNLIAQTRLRTKMTKGSQKGPFCLK